MDEWWSFFSINTTVCQVHEKELVLILLKKILYLKFFTFLFDIGLNFDFLFYNSVS